MALDRLRTVSHGQWGVRLSESVIGPATPPDAKDAFALLVEGATEYAVFTLSPNGLVSTWNRGAERIKGYQAEEVVGRHFSLFYLPADQEAGKPAQELSQAVSEGRMASEGWRVRGDGSLFWASVLVTPIWDEVGRLRGFAKLVRDESDRRARQELDEQVERLADRERIGTALTETLVRRLFEVGLQLNSVLALTEDPEVLRRTGDAVAGIDRSLRYIREAVFDISQREDVPTKARLPQEGALPSA